MSENRLRSWSFNAVSLLVVLYLGIVGCGQGSGQGNGSITTTGYSCNELALSAAFYISSSYTSSTGHWAALGGYVNKDYQVTWLNETNGNSGSAIMYTTDCHLTFVFYPGLINVCAWTASIPLTAGVNSIMLDTYDTSGNQQGRICTSVTGSA